MLRIALFLATNFAVMIVASITMRLLGIGNIVGETGLQYGSLLGMCAVFGFTGSIISLLISKFMAKRSMGVQLIDSPNTQSEQWLLQTVRELAEKANIDMPEVGIFPAQEANAFATGWNRNSALVAVSHGLLEQMTQEEVKAVLAHEIAHVTNGDMVTLALIQGVVNTFVMFFARIIGYAIDRHILQNKNGQGIGYWISSMIAEVLLGMLASMIVMWFSRKREYKADALSAELYSREAMINALKRLKGDPIEGKEMPKNLSVFGIKSATTGGLKSLFRTHPSLDDRIQALQHYPYGE